MGRKVLLVWIKPITFKKIFFKLLLLLFFYFTILYWFCHTSTCIRHGCTHVPHPEPPSHLPPHTIPLGHPSAPAPSFLYPASNLDRRFVSYVILYMFSVVHGVAKSRTWLSDFTFTFHTCFNAILPNHSPLPLPQSPKDGSIHMYLFCCLAYRVVVTIFLNSIYMH